ncbi:MAG: hypothetical protein Q8S20_05505 [Sulfuritalea sp.]|nr:hypothetical protein [Sulfuritalea sp.]
MKATVQLLRRYGRKLRKRNLGEVTWLSGQLQMFSVQHRAYGSVQVLQLSAIDNQTSDGHLATLYEPVITGLGNGRMTFRGIERMESEEGPVGYAQEWRVELMT